MNDVFIDTDAILDLFIDREPHHTIALHLFSRLKLTNSPCYTSPLVIANINYILAKIKNKHYALEKVKKIRNLLGIITIDEAVIDSAIRSPYRDFEDSIQYYSAIGSNIKYLITRNTRDFPKGEIMVISPEDYLRITGFKEEV